MPREAQLAWGVWRVGKAWGWTERGKWGLKERKFKEPWGHGSGWTPHVCKVVFEDYFLKRNRGWGVLLAFIWVTHQHHPTFPGEPHLSLLKLSRVGWASPSHIHHTAWSRSHRGAGPTPPSALPALSPVPSTEQRLPSTYFFPFKVIWAHTGARNVNLPSLQPGAWSSLFCSLPTC